MGYVDRDGEGHIVGDSTSHTEVPAFLGPGFEPEPQHQM